MTARFLAIAAVLAVLGCQNRETTDPLIGRWSEVAPIPRWLTVKKDRSYTLVTGARIGDKTATQSGRWHAGANTLVLEDSEGRQFETYSFAVGRDVLTLANRRVVIASVPEGDLKAHLDMDQWVERMNKVDADKRFIFKRDDILKTK